MSAQPVQHLPSSELSEPLLGSTEPRIWTRPLVELTPDTSYGYAVIEFARDVLCQPLDPWEEWVAIHGGELLPDGRPRFRRLLVLVARQNGKTHLLVVLTLYWLFVECQALVLGTSTNLDYAAESWQKCADTIEATPELAALVPHNWLRRANGQQMIKTGIALDKSDSCRYKIAASNVKGGRSLTVNRLILDELREHHDWSAYGASYNACQAVSHAQLWAISNQGGDQSVVLNELRADALAWVESGKGDRRLGLFEYSAPDGCDLLDPQGWRAANPNLGYRIDPETISGAALTAQLNGGEQEASFRTEILCQRVRTLDGAIDPASWVKSVTDRTLASAVSRVALCVDIAPDGMHATLTAAAYMPGDTIRVEPVAAWDGRSCTEFLRAALPDWVAKINPRVLGWFPNGPAAAIAADLRTINLGARVEITEIKADMAAVCMGFAEQVASGQIEHSADPLQDAHVNGAEKLRTGDKWVFSRRAGGHVDAAYAAAGAVHLARTAPPAVGGIRIITAD